MYIVHAEIEIIIKKITLLLGSGQNLNSKRHVCGHFYDAIRKNVHCDLNLNKLKRIAKISRFQALTRLGSRL